jgi:ABC-type antimicrobial peptide transport system permease subunit
MIAPDAKSNDVGKRQIVLPYRVAVRMAYENIRLRLTRSLLATGGIVLGVAFLNSVMVTNLSVRGMQQWAASASVSPRFAELRQERSELEQTLKNGNSETQEKLAQIRSELSAPETLQAMMTKNGVPVTSEEIINDRIQKRWLLGLGLVVAFIGILNSMLMSVTERFREIGTMKCLGALDSFIIRLFLIESVFQGVVGTILGILIGTAMSMAGQTVSYGAFAWKNIPWQSLGESVGFCFLVGLALTVAGAIYPAWQAARMQPIVAMRVET